LIIDLAFGILALRILVWIQKNKHKAKRQVYLAIANKTVAYNRFLLYLYADVLVATNSLQSMTGKRAKNESLLLGSFCVYN
jgi:hypothetical protein